MYVSLANELAIVIVAKFANKVSLPVLCFVVILIYFSLLLVFTVCSVKLKRCLKCNSQIQQKETAGKDLGLSAFIYSYSSLVLSFMF